MLLVAGWHVLQDCCFSSCDPLVASALVSGQLLLHRYTAQQAPAGPTQQQQQQQQQQGSDADDEQQPAASTSYSVQQVLCRDSKKAASCRAVCFASDGSHLLCGFETGSILQLDPASGKAVTRLTKVHSAGINRLLGIPEQPSLLAAGDMDGGLCIWDLRSQQHVLKYSKHSDYISGLTVSEKQQALLAVSGDGTLSVHDLRSCKALARSEDDADDELISGEGDL
jgi:ATP-dependent RNA helicase DOB1